MTRKTLAILLALATAQFVFFSSHPERLASFGIPFFGNLGFFIFILASQLVLFLSFSRREFTKAGKYAVVTSALAVITAAVTVLKSNFIDQGLLGLTSVTLTFISWYLLSLAHTKFGSIPELITIPFALVQTWNKAALTASKKIFFLPGKSRIPAIVAGVGIALPLLVILIGLLGSADPIFGSLTKSLFSFNWIGSRLVVSAIILAVVVPITYMKIDRVFKINSQVDKILPQLVLSALIVVGSVSTVLLTFLLVQFRYLFANVSERELHQFGVQTYSEYVQKGFGELLLVSLIVYATAIGGLLIYNSLKNKHRMLLSTNILLLTEMLFFIFSIFRRVGLYQMEHGLTRSRIYGSAFLIGLVILTLILILRHFIRSKQSYLYEILTVLTVIVLTTSIGVDRLIAQNNPPTVNGEIDYVYISRLSPDAYTGWISSYNHAKSELNFLRQTVQPYSQDQKRRIVYAYYILDNIKQNTARLNYKYQDNKYLTLKDINFYERHSQIKLKGVISEAELLALHGEATILFNSIPWQEVRLFLDRGLDSL